MELVWCTAPDHADNWCGDGLWDHPAELGVQNAAKKKQTKKQQQPKNQKPKHYKSNKLVRKNNNRNLHTPAETNPLPPAICRMCTMSRCGWNIWTRFVLKGGLKCDGNKKKLTPELDFGQNVMAV